MGAHDDREKLEVAIEEVGRLERELADEKIGRQKDYDWMKAKIGCVADERDAAYAENRATAGRALHTFADKLAGTYTLNHASTTALLDHVVSLAHRDADLAGA